MCYTAEFARSRSHGTSVIKEIRLKKLTLVSRLSRSLKVIGTDTYRSATYDFLLTLYSNHGTISYSFRNKRWFQSKIESFSTPVYFAPSLKGFSWNWVPSLGRERERSLGVKKLPGRERNLTISSAVWIKYTNRQTGHSDGQTPGDSKDCAYA